MMNWKLIDLLLSLLFPTFILFHLILTPYTKVEESFNLQATHDILQHGIPIPSFHPRDHTPLSSQVQPFLQRNYDHFIFPGVVPRTFVGSVVLSSFSQPYIALFGQQHAQTTVRAVLGLFNATCLLWFKRRVGRAFGKDVGRWYVLLQTVGQFHIMYYASRTLPNMFAFGFTTLAFSFLLPNSPASSLTQDRPSRNHRLAISLLVFSTTIFRSETAILLLTISLTLLMTRQITILQLIPPFAISFISALMITVPIDSFFWQPSASSSSPDIPLPLTLPLPQALHPYLPFQAFIWPELTAFYFNAVQGQSSDWGTSPWHFYFTSILPKLLTISLPFIPYTLLWPASRQRAMGLVVPCLAFVGIYSLQAHKEARFVFYVVPPLTAVGALQLTVAWRLATKSLRSWWAGGDEKEAPKEVELSTEDKEKHTRRWRKVLFLRHKIQRGFGLPNQEPKEDDMAATSNYLTQLEYIPDLEADIIKTTKVNKVLKAILKLESIPNEEDFHFKTRSQTMLDKCNQILAENEKSSTKGKSNKPPPLIPLFTVTLIIGGIALSFLASTALLLFSSLNYPGGEALALLPSVIQGHRSQLPVSPYAVPIHADVLTCMTGTTLFLRSASALPLSLDRTEDNKTLRDPMFWRRFDYVLTGDPEGDVLWMNRADDEDSGEEWRVLGVVEGFAGIEVLRPGGKAGNDIERGGEDSPTIVGRGELVKRVRVMVRKVTGGWWVGPRMKGMVWVVGRVKDEGRGVIREDNTW